MKFTSIKRGGCNRRATALLLQKTFKGIRNLLRRKIMLNRQRNLTSGNRRFAPEQDGQISREQLIFLLNEDLAREYQAVIAYVVYSQVLKGAAYMTIAKELENHAKQELDHALIIAKQI